jgi:RNA polymerase sigma-70 factor (ECF subfamily)
VESELSELYREHAPELLRFARTITPDAEEGRDAVQEAFLRCCSEQRQGREIESPRAWLFQVVRNLLVAQKSSAAARTEVVSAKLDSMAGESGNPEALAARRQRAEEIRDRLTKRELACLRLRAQGMSYEEIGGALHIRSGTVGALLARVNGKLRWPPVGDGNIDIGVAEAVHCLFLGGGSVERHASTR